MPRLRLFVVVALLSAAHPPPHAQWLNYPTPGTPRTPDGKPNLAAPAPAPQTASPTSPASGRVRPHRSRNGSVSWAATASSRPQQ